MLSDSKSPPFGAVGKRAATCEEWASDEEDREESEPVRRRDPAGQDFGEHGPRWARIRRKVGRQVKILSLEPNKLQYVLRFLIPFVCRCLEPIDALFSVYRCSDSKIITITETSLSDI